MLLVNLTLGKSSLINKLVGYKVAIVTPKPQTTRFNIKGIATSETSQIVFVDTPGVYEPKNKMGEYMNKGISNVVKGVDTLLYVVDSTHASLDDASKRVIADIVKLNKKTILVVNKIDKIKKEKILDVIYMYSEYAKKFGFEFVEVVPISVRTSQGLDVLVSCIEKYLDESEMLYAQDEVTDITEREIVEEIIREKILRNLQEEVPHGINVMVESFEEKENENGDITYYIRANIICKRQSYKPILLGENGKMLRHIINESRQSIAKTLDVKVNLKVDIKVRKDWDDNENFLKNIRYRNDV